MSNKKSLKKYCSPIKYIEYNYPKYFHIYTELCLEYLARPGGGDKGLTILIPKNSKDIDEMHDLVYSTDPIKVVHLIKAMTISGYYPDLDSFNGATVRNKLGQIIEVSEVKKDGVHLTSGGVITPVNDYHILARERNGEEYPPNTAIYLVSKKIPTDGPTTENDKVGGGGGVAAIGLHNTSSYKEKIHQIVEKKYAEQIGTPNNIYYLKVFLHLNLLKDHGDDVKDIEAYMGNDEVSDSYLLDMYCEKYCPKCFEILYHALDSVVADGKNGSRNDYLSIKRELFPGNANDKVDRPFSNLQGLRNPIGIRERVISIYNQHSSMEFLARDLFIVFCNVSKLNWMKTPYNKAAEYKEFSYLVSCIYVNLDSMLERPYEPQRDITEFGNLLRSDVLLLKVQAEYTFYMWGTVDDIPSPVEMKQTHLSALVHSLSNIVTGGHDNHEVRKLIDLVKS